MVSDRWFWGAGTAEYRKRLMYFAKCACVYDSPEDLIKLQILMQ